jgi:DNA end-binding protein Ku
MPPPSRAYWKGYLRLALVQIAVQIHSATEASKSSMNLIHKPSGKRINYESPCKASRSTKRTW